MLSTLVLALIPLGAPVNIVVQDPAPKPVAAQSKPALAEWQKAYAMANKLASEKKFAEAAGAYAEILEMKDLPATSRSGILLSMARAESQAGNKEKAVDLMVMAIDAGFYTYSAIESDNALKAIFTDAKVKDAVTRNAPKKEAFDAELKKKMDEAAKKRKEDMLEKLKDPNGAGFEFTFNLTGLDGKPVTSDGIKGKVAIVDIWGTWCPPCRAELPHFIELVKKHRGDDFVMIGLNDEHLTAERKRDHINGEKEAEIARKFAKDNSINYQLALIDPATFKQVPGFKGYPTTLFIDKKGKVRFVEVGFRDGETPETLETIVSTLLAEK